MGDEEITISTLADSALMALVKIVISINEKNKNQFMKYRTNEAIIKRMGVDWEVKLGWGLHTGWAIEGAIGSRFKIDASYLSPHVNLSEDLEGATKFYGVPFLVSEAMVNILSPFARSLCRRVDRVKIAGIEAPFDLYCVDVWQWHRDKLKKMGLATEGPFVGKFRAHRGKSYTRSEKKFFTDKELRGIHEGIPEKHSKLWAEALQLYLDGDWGKAKIICQQTLDLLPTDYWFVYVLYCYPLIAMCAHSLCFACSVVKRFWATWENFRTKHPTIGQGTGCMNKGGDVSS